MAMKTWTEIPWEEAVVLAKECKYKISKNDMNYYANAIRIEGGYVRFVPVVLEDKSNLKWYKPSEALKEMWVRADVIEDPVFTGGADLTEILLAVMPIAAMFLLPRVLR